jgi:hypothetical protein
MCVPGINCVMKNATRSSSSVSISRPTSREARPTIAIGSARLSVCAGSEHQRAEFARLLTSETSTTR